MVEPIGPPWLPPHPAVSAMSRQLSCSFLALALALAGTFQAGADTGAPTLRVGVDDQDPPLSFLADDGRLAGFDIDVANALCAALKARCELIRSEWDALIPGLTEHRLDFVVASMAITEKRRELVDFTRAYYDRPGRFIGRRGRLHEATPQSVKGLRIGVVSRTTYDDYATDNLSRSATITRYRSQPDALLDLLMGRIDLVLDDHLVLEQNFLRKGSGAGFEFIGGPLADTHWFGDGAGIAVAKGDDSLRELLDRAVADIHANGVFEHIELEWFGYDVRDLTGDLERDARAAR